MDDEQLELPGVEEEELFAADSPRWRDTGDERPSTARRREEDTPAPTRDTEGAIERDANDGANKNLED